MNVVSLWSSKDDSLVGVLAWLARQYAKIDVLS
jgi:hypothetical protein